MMLQQQLVQCRHGGEVVGARRQPSAVAAAGAPLPLCPRRLQQPQQPPPRTCCAAAANKQQQQPTKSSSSSKPRRAPKKQQSGGGGASKKQPPQQQQPATDDALACVHFGACPGCTLQHDLWTPPVAAAAAEFFSARLAADDSAPFVVTPGPVHDWRCRAKLAVRGRRGAPQVGLFERGSHTVTTSIVPECRTHHPRVNEAALLVQRVAAALAVPLYQEQQEQQQQQRGSPGSSSGSSGSSGALRYLQLTALPGVEGGRAEEDEAAAQVQLVLVWSAPDAAHASFAELQRLAAALWSEGGPAAPPSPLAQLRARAEAAAAARGGAAAAKQRSSSSRGPSAAAGAPAAATQRKPLLHSIWANFQPEPDSNSVLGPSWQLLHGPETGWQQFGQVQLAVTPGSFVQANYGAFQQCLAAIAAAMPRQASLLELYAGSGVIGLSLAAAGAVQRVLAVEVNPLAAGPFEQSVQRLAAADPAAAARVAHVTASAADAQALARVLASHYSSSAAQQPNVLLVDPPRKGLDAAVLELLGAAPLRSVTRLVYVSCGFEALRRDADALLAAGWRLTSARGLLFFPGTDALETLAVFDR